MSSIINRTDQTYYRHGKRNPLVLNQSNIWRIYWGECST